jgi:hypothetical protein
MHRSMQRLNLTRFKKKLVVKYSFIFSLNHKLLNIDVHRNTKNLRPLFGKIISYFTIPFLSNKLN